MPRISAVDGTALYYEESGSGTPLVFVHEFAGNYRTWEPQMRYFSRSHRCITFSARGYPPSDVPADGASYGQDIARQDVIALMDALGIDRAHVVGHSMGAYTALHVGLHHPQRCLSVAAIGCGWGSSPSERDASVQLCQDIAAMFRDEPIEQAADKYANFAMRLSFKAKDPRGFAEFSRMLAENSGP
ncbi:MAG: alpha/beta hydrolase, partial [Paucimonas sp.]|nr:alpha/beta hydrolase [Paucimonas sp.]